MAVTRPMTLSVTASAPFAPDVCASEGQVTLSQGTRLVVRKHGPVYWMQVTGSIVGKDLPLLASSDETFPVLTCAKW